MVNGYVDYLDSDNVGVHMCQNTLNCTFYICILLYVNNTAIKWFCKAKVKKNRNKEQERRF